MNKLLGFLKNNIVLHLVITLLLFLLVGFQGCNNMNKNKRILMLKQEVATVHDLNDKLSSNGELLDSLLEKQTKKILILEKRFDNPSFGEEDIKEALNQ